MEQKSGLPDEQKDEVLVALTLAGERTAFDVLFLRYFASVQRLCIRLLKTTLESQDVAQEAALQAFLGLKRLQEPARFGAWFHAIAANLARSALRKQREFSLQILSDEQEIQRQLGHQPQMASFMAGNKKDIMQTLPPNIGGLMASGVSQGWTMVVILAQKPARDLGEEVHQQMSQTRRQMAELLSQ